MAGVVRLTRDPAAGANVAHAMYGFASLRPLGRNLVGYVIAGHGGLSRKAYFSADGKTFTVAPVPPNTR